ncbi:MAG: hypothetical protein H7318_19155 [Oligoflexus sp.]|nr:hypothetical protein [Oligoflexus sp.]
MKSILKPFILAALSLQSLFGRAEAIGLTEAQELAVQHNPEMKTLKAEIEAITAHFNGWIVSEGEISS